MLLLENERGQQAQDVRVVRSLDPGLDQKAIDAVSQWRFKPGMKDGKAVVVRVQVKMNYTLK